MRAITTNSFLDSIGVVTHVEYVDIAWSNWDAIPEMLDYIGVKHVREAAPHDWTQPVLERLAEDGIKFNLGVRGPHLDLRESFGAIAALEAAQPGSVAFIEGPNELNLFDYVYRGRKVQSDQLRVARDIHEEMQRLAGQNDGLSDVPIIGFSLGGAGPWKAAAQIGRFSHLTDYSNWHTYFGAEQPRRVARETRDWAQTLNDDPVIFTEAGYHNALGLAWEGVDEATEAKLTLNMLLDNFQLGVRKTFIYSLMNDRLEPDPHYQEDNFGLFDGDGTPQPVAHALHNLNAILRDGDDYTATFETSELELALEDLPADGHHILMQKSDGAFALVVWAEPDIWNDAADRPIEVPEQRVTVEFPERMDVAFLDPLEGVAPLHEASSVLSYDFAVSAHPVVIKITRRDAADAGRGTDGELHLESSRAVQGVVEGELALNLADVELVRAFAPDTTGSGNWARSDAGIAGTRDDRLYQTNLWSHDRMSLDFAVARPGTYGVELHLSETWEGAFGAGKRVFDVIAEGAVVDDDLDIYAHVGANAALVRRYEVEVEDGVLDLDFEGEVQNPTIAGLRIFEVEPHATAGGGRSDSRSVPLELVEAVNIGSERGYTAANGVVFGADDTGVGRSSKRAAPIAGTEDDALYHSSAWHPKGLDHRFDVADGLYLVKLHFAEVWPGAFAEGRRVFDVRAEGSLIDDDLDVFREAGGRDAALVKGHLVSVDDGALDLELVAGVQNPSLNAIELFRLADRPAEVVRAVNLGSSQTVTAADGTVYAADDTGVGYWHHQPRAVAGTEDDALFASEAWWPAELGYRFAVEDGLYEVELGFAELYDGTKRIGARVFDVALEGRLVEVDLDVFAEVGAHAALVRTYRAQVDDGSLDIDLHGEVENPSVNALKISRVLEDEFALGDPDQRYEVAGLDGGFSLVAADDGFAIV